MSTHSHVENALRSIQKLRDFPGPPDQFWPALCEVFGRLTGAVETFVLLRDEVGAASWISSGHWPVQSGQVLIPQAPELLALIDHSLHHPGSHSAMISGAQETAWLAVRLTVQHAILKPRAVLLMRAPGNSPDWIDAASIYAEIFSDTAHLYFRGREAAQLGGRNGSGSKSIASVLDILAVLNSQKDFDAVALALVNETASAFDADRVCLGWRQQEYIRLVAVSGSEKIAHRLDLVRLMESAMEECADQDEELLWPANQDNKVINRLHQSYARSQGLAHVVSLPLRLEAQPEAVLMIERGGDIPFTQEDERGLRLLCDLVIRRLYELHRQSGSFFQRATRYSREFLEQVAGPEHTLVKACSLLAAATLAFLLFFPWPFRVEAPFALETSAIAQIPAPFDGYIAEVPARIGDQIPKGGIILRIDPRNLRIAREEALAERTKAESQARSALSVGKLSEMMTAQAQADQAGAKVDLTALQLELAEIKAPFDGIIVEGDLREKIGSPFRKGDILFRFARIEDLYAQVKVNEADIDWVKLDATGKLAFASRPENRYRFSVERINPAAEARQEGNIFMVKVQFQDSAEGWWRPGMTGIAKIDVDTRTPFFVLTRRALDWLRMKLWL